MQKDVQALNVIDVTASNGSITTDTDGNFVFTPTADFHGTVTLSYKVSDGTAKIEASNSFFIAEVNDAPVLTSGVAPVLADGTEDVQYAINASELLLSFSDVDPSSLNILALSSESGTIRSKRELLVPTPSLRIKITTAL